MDSFEFYYNLDKYNKNSLFHGAEAGSEHENVKYYKREGIPGNYKYYYTKEEYEASKLPENKVETVTNVGPTAQQNKTFHKNENKLSAHKSIYTPMQTANKINNAKISNKYDKKFVDTIKDNDSMTKEERVEEYKNYLQDPTNYTQNIYITNRLTKLGEGGNVNLNLRPEISTEELIKAGWKEEDVGDGYATVFSSTYTNTAEDKAYNFTPIVMDPKTGEYIECMSPKDFDEYCYEVIEGLREDDKMCQIGGAIEGDDVINRAEKIAQEIHNLHEQQHVNNEQQKSK